MSKHLANTKFSFIRYSNVWEDPNVLLQSLDAKSGSKMLSIASAGDNALAMLLLNPSEIVAVDLNSAQLSLMELKIVAIRELERSDVLKFLGFHLSDKRIYTYHSLRLMLSKEARNYWDHNSHLIESGVVFCGKFEKYLQMFAQKILPWIHRPETVDQILEPKHEAAQVKFYNQKWNSWKWRLFLKTFFSRKLMGLLGRDPSFLSQVKLNVGKFIMKQSAQHLKSVQAQNNHILEFCLKGAFQKNLPLYLRAEYFNKVKSNLSSVILFKGYVEDAISNFGSFDAYNLSNIFEYMPMGKFKKITSHLISTSNSKALFSYWNLMVPRIMSNHSQLIKCNLNGESLQAQDLGFFYRSFISEIKF